MNLIGLCCFGLTGGLGRDKKDAEASKIVTSPYKCTAEAIFGGRKSENFISPSEGIRKDSDIFQQIRLYKSRHQMPCFRFFGLRFFSLPKSFFGPDDFSRHKQKRPGMQPCLFGFIA